MTASACSTNGRPESHSSTPSHQLRKPFTVPTLVVAGTGLRTRNTSVAAVDAERVDGR
ncbi:MAG: hypothetical protein EKK34_06675 [Mycobacterium sp.]|nr:MAG: hypothetical protein EKK34_06675 [Mycobacterium sp.]